MTPKQYLELKRQKESEIAALRAEIEESWMESNRTPQPENLRPAESGDIVLGAVIWYNVGPDEYYPTEWGWYEVEEVLRPCDDWKAFTTDDCRRGLYGAFVENVQGIAAARCGLSPLEPLSPPCSASSSSEL